ncbi:MAG: hypothetical protein IJ637_00415 [Prevotella sp.]|nr:hypothetical protein [Prevotella sp.]
MFQGKFCLALVLLAQGVCCKAYGAQDTLQAHVDYQLTAETAVGTGRYTAFHLAANRHHALATRPNTAYLRAAATAQYPLGHDWQLHAGIDAIAAVHADHKAYLQQWYANLSWRSFFVEAGAREQRPVLRNEQLSSGAFVKGANAKPIPQIHAGTNGFWTVPYTRDWLQVDFDFGYGKFLDSQYREDQFRTTTNNRQYATGIYYHQKHLYLRTNPTKPLFITAGIEHAVQFGGNSYKLLDGQLQEKTKPANLRAMWEVILPLGDSKYYENEAMEDWVWGNHIGSMTVQVGWNIDAHHQLQAYVDDPFEDGSGMRKGNGADGLYGLEYRNTAPGRQLVRQVVVEHLQTTNQSGPLHYDRADYPEPIRSQITTLVAGNDEYYNHTYYDSYSHYGMTPGNPLITSPIYNADGRTQYTDNRVRAWHAAATGQLTDQLSYLAKITYREGLGTYYVPIYPRHHSFDALLQATYQRGPLSVAGACALTTGNIMGHSTTFDIKISYHGKIF